MVCAGSILAGYLIGSFVPGYSSGMKNLPVAIGIAFTSFPKLVGLPIALSFIFQMLTASTFYRILLSKKKEVTQQ